MEPEYRREEWLEVTFKGMVQADSEDGFFTTSAGEGEATFAVDDPGITVKRLGPHFEADHVYADRDGGLWLCQNDWGPNGEGPGELKLISVLGILTVEEAVKSYSPFTQLQLIGRKP